MTDEFQSLDDLGWYGSAFFLTLAAFQSTWGKAYKYFDLKTVFIIAIVVFELGSLTSGTSYAAREPKVFFPCAKVSNQASPRIVLHLLSDEQLQELVGLVSQVAVM